MSTSPIQGDKLPLREQLECNLPEKPQVVTQHAKTAAVLLPGLQREAVQIAGKRSLKVFLLSATGLTAITVPARGCLKLRRA